MSPKEIYNPRIYKNIGYDDLVVFSLFSLIQKEVQPTFENMVSECFNLFPSRFYLPGYPQWPDSSIVEKSWVRCRTDKHLIIGSRAKGFKLTQKGLDLVGKLSNILKISKESKKSLLALRGDRRTRSGRIVKQLEKSPTYKHYLKKEFQKITEFDFLDMIYCTTESSLDARKDNFNLLKQHVNDYERGDLNKFLKYTEKKFKHLLSEDAKKQYSGGMMKKKISK